MCRGVLRSLTGHTTVRLFLVNLKAKDLGEREREMERERERGRGRGRGRGREYIRGCI